MSDQRIPFSAHRLNMRCRLCGVGDDGKGVLVQRITIEAEDIDWGKRRGLPEVSVSWREHHNRAFHPEEPTQ